MHGGGKRNYECHMIIHNGQFAECEVLENFQELCGPRVQGQGLVNWSLRTTTLIVLWPKCLGLCADTAYRRHSCSSSWEHSLYKTGCTRQPTLLTEPHTNSLPETALPLPEQKLFLPRHAMMWLVSQQNFIPKCFVEHWQNALFACG